MTGYIPLDMLLGFAIAGASGAAFYAAWSALAARTGRPAARGTRR